MFRRTEQHIRLHNEPLWDRDIPGRTGTPRLTQRAALREQRGFSAAARCRTLIPAYEAPRDNNTKKRNSDDNIATPAVSSRNTSNQRWRERNLRPHCHHLVAEARCSKNLRLSYRPHQAHSNPGLRTKKIQPHPSKKKQQ